MHRQGRVSADAPLDALSLAEVVARAARQGFIFGDGRWTLEPPSLVLVGRRPAGVAA